MTERRILQVAAALAVMMVAAGCAGGQVGLVDSQRILTESAKALRYQKQIDDRERAYFTDLQLLANQLSREDLEARRAQYFQELQDLRTELTTRLNREIDQAVRDVARQRRLRGVIVRGPVVYTRPGTTVDITQDVIDRLK